MRRVFVTGAGHGIGRAIVEAFVANGDRVAFCDIDVERGNEVSIATGARFFALDVCDVEALESAVQTLLNEWGDLDIIVNNVGIGGFQPITKCSVEHFERVLNTNLRSVFITSRLLAIHREKMGAANPYGRIINLCSTRYLQSEANSEAYAASKGIDVIPEIDLPGHMLGALASYPELGCTGGPYEVWTRWGVSEDVLCAGNEAVYTFLEDVLTEVCELFPYEYIHVGGDECPKVRWESCPKCQAKIKELKFKDDKQHKAEHYLQSYVITRMEKFLNSKGRKLIGWDEILEGGIAPNATIMSWRGEKGGLEAVRQGHDAIMTPNTYFYLDYYQSADIENEPFGIGGYLPVEKCYSYEPYPAGMTEEETKHIIGVQANMWTEYISEVDHLYYMLLPRLAALAEVQWCNADRKDWDRFFNAADNFCKVYDVMGYNYATHILQVKGSVEAKPAENCAVVTLAAQGDAPIRYTLDGTAPTKRSKLYTEPLVISENCVLTAAAMRKGIEPKNYVRKFDFHKAVGKELTFSRKAHRNYSAAAPANLIDGVRGPKVFKSIEWTAWHGKPVDLMIDMAETQPYSSVTLGMLTDKPSHIFFPTKIAVAVSEDGENYTEIAAQEYELEGKDDPDGTKDFTVSFAETSARYLKVTVEPTAAMPEWHHKKGGATFIFLDEIIVR